MDIPPDMWLAFIRPLNRLGVEYMVTGSAASMAYGEPRLTLDVDMIVRKLEFYREGRSEKHLRDIAGMLRVSGEVIDQQAIEEWARRLGLTEEWKTALLP